MWRPAPQVDGRAPTFAIVQRKQRDSGLNRRRLAHRFDNSRELHLAVPIKCADQLRKCVRWWFGLAVAPPDDVRASAQRDVAVGIWTSRRSLFFLSVAWECPLSEAPRQRAPL
jgi:hypothetical protein